MIGAIPGNDVVGLSFANPAGFFALALAIPVLVLHVLRPRRPQSTVASVLLWRAVDAPVSAARPWQRLRWSVLLALQLAAVTLLAFGLARPVRATKAPLAAHTVFVVDASGSMAAKDGKPDRLESARRAVRKLRAQLPAGGVASIVIASPEPQVLLSSSGDQDAFDAALRRIAVVAGPARWQDTFNLAASLETPGKPIGIVLVSDGGLDRTEQRIIPAGVASVGLASAFSSCVSAGPPVGIRAIGDHGALPRW